MLGAKAPSRIIVGIVSSYLAHTRSLAMVPAVWIGVIAAIVGCIALGAALQFAGTGFPQRQQEFFEGCVPR